MGDSHVGLQARLMSQALRKLAGTLNRTDTICIFTNQLREKIGVMFGIAGDDAGRPRAQVLLVGPPRHPPHRDAQGRAPRRSATACASRSSRTRSRRRSSRPSSTSSTATGSPGRAPSSTSALERKIVQKSGSYFSFGDERLGQGRQNATAFLTREPRPRPADPRPDPGRGGPEQIVSARLLPTAAPPEEVTPIADEVAAEV